MLRNIFIEVFEMCLSEYLTFDLTVEEPNDLTMKSAQSRWMQLCKPLHSLGALEEIVIRLAGIQNQVFPEIERKAVVIFAADNGIVNQGVTQCGQEVTAQVTANFVRGITTVNALAKVAGVDLYPVDVGINQQEPIPGVINRRICRGTKDFSYGPAMSKREVQEALNVGYELAKQMKRCGYDIVGVGEMGIGNTTTSSAVLSVLAGCDPIDVTGRGAGLSDEMLKRKIKAIENGIKVNQPDSSNPLDVLQKVGGLDLVSMTGFYLGAAAMRLPVVIDGFISSVAALSAVRIKDTTRSYLFASHLSTEPGAVLAMNELKLTPYLQCGMRVGEGTGCCVAFGIFDHAVTAYREIASFLDAGVATYQEQDKKQ